VALLAIEQRFRFEIGHGIHLQLSTTRSADLRSLMRSLGCAMHRLVLFFVVLGCARVARSASIPPGFSLWWWQECENIPSVFAGASAPFFLTVGLTLLTAVVVGDWLYIDGGDTYSITDGQSNFSPCKLRFLCGFGSFPSLLALPCCSESNHRDFIVELLDEQLSECNCQQQTSELSSFATGYLMV
jgi:hypothetical protein